jgi:hypothetical protein
MYDVGGGIDIASISSTLTDKQMPHDNLCVKEPALNNLDHMIMDEGTYMDSKDTAEMVKIEVLDKLISHEDIVDVGNNETKICTNDIGMCTNSSCSSSSSSSIHSDSTHEIVEGSIDVSKCSSSSSSSAKSKGIHKEKEHNYYTQIMEPNEPVYMGSKKYGKLFIFWQLIGWFNAGSDQKIEAPDLFGCVQLPVPASCFGPSETGYGEKQRELLIAHLREEKAQSMPWSAALKACFSGSHVAASVNGRSLLGSPMLDGALGQVDSITRVITELCGRSHDNHANSISDNSQFDSILPPEVPTSWVQCELCRKWRRVAWHVDGESLPDQVNTYTSYSLI